MANVWSFNTTVRNPERMETMLRVLSEMEGIDFNASGQEQFFGLLIKKRLYTPTRGKLGDSSLINAVYGGSHDDLDANIVEDILSKYRSGSVDGAGRGRTAAGILNRFGLCVALQSKGPVVITSVGKKWLNNEIDDEELFTKFFLKWQYPNQIESGYRDCNIKPFPAVLSLIRRVNEEWERLGNNPVGLEKDEYRLFAPALKNESNIESYTAQIISYRSKKKILSNKERSDFINDYARQRAIGIYGLSNETNLRKQIADLKDYSDSSIRYFRVSGLIALRGGGTHIDIAHDKSVEADSILKTMNLSAKEFQSYEEYLGYLNDLSQPALPWENEEDLTRISSKLTSMLVSEAKEAKIEISTANLEQQPLAKRVIALHERINDVRIEKLRGLRHNIEVLDESIAKLSSITDRNYETLTSRPSLDFEWYTSRALMVLNDAIRIDPSFKVGDDGIPTGFRGNTSDIECEYETFGLTVEVTLLLGRDQWVAEGQPVMRHLRDFEDKLSENKGKYCLFVSPFIHRDTLNTFWTNNKHGYEGVRQNIIPLKLDQFIEFLRLSRAKIINGDLSHKTIESLLLRFSLSMDKYDDSRMWTEEFTELIATW
jgi:hypothetical protein